MHKEQKKFKFLLEVRDRMSQTDSTVLATDSFQEVVEEYNSLKKILLEKKDSCSFDIIVFYVLVEALTPAGDTTPVVMSMVDTVIKEW